LCIEKVVVINGLFDETASANVRFSSVFHANFMDSTQYNAQSYHSPCIQALNFIPSGDSTAASTAAVVWKLKSSDGFTADSSYLTTYSIPAVDSGGELQIASVQSLHSMQNDLLEEDRDMLNFIADDLAETKLTVIPSLIFQSISSDSNSILFYSILFYSLSFFSSPASPRLASPRAGSSSEESPLSGKVLSVLSSPGSAELRPGGRAPELVQGSGGRDGAAHLPPAVRGLPAAQPALDQAAVPQSRILEVHRSIS
jgi:hypothetical protein